MGDGFLQIKRPNQQYQGISEMILSCLMTDNDIHEL